MTRLVLLCLCASLTTWWERGSHETSWRRRESLILVFRWVDWFYTWTLTENGQGLHYYTHPGVMLYGTELWTGEQFVTFCGRISGLEVRIYMMWAVIFGLAICSGIWEEKKSGKLEKKGCGVQECEIHWHSCECIPPGRDTEEPRRQMIQSIDIIPLRYWILVPEW